MLAPVPAGLVMEGRTAAIEQRMRALSAAGPLWLDYLSYLSAPKPGTQAYVALWTTGMVGGQEEGTRAAALR